MQMQGFRKDVSRAAIALAAAALLGTSPAFAQTGTSTGTAASGSGKLDPVCASYGPGFARLPGSSTCVKISGGVQADIYSTDTSVSGSGALTPALRSK